MSVLVHRQDLTIHLIAQSGAMVVTGGAYIIMYAGYTSLNIPALDALFGYRNWSLIQEAWFFNTPNLRVMKARMGFSRVLAGLASINGAETLLTNNAGAARSAFMRIIYTPAHIIATLAEAATETVLVSAILGSDAGANLNAYGGRLFVASNDLNIAALSALGVG
jgi:hypothetical protein